MTGLKIAAAVLLILGLLSLLRLGGEAEYSAGGLSVWIRVGPFRIHVFPVKKKREKPKNAGKKKEKKPPHESEKKSGGSLDLVRQYLPLVTEAAGALRRRIRIDRLYLDFTAGNADPARAAMSFGYLNMAVGMIWPLFEQNFEVKGHRIRTAVDFNSPKPAVYISFCFTARLGQLVSFALRFGLKFFKIYQSGKQSANGKREAI